MGLDQFKDVRDFQEKFGHLSHYKPTKLTKRKLLERIKFMQEELDEFTRGCGITRMHGALTPEDVYYDDGGVQDFAEQADALVDLVYVALGSAVMLGLPWQELWDDVQRANMAKERGISHRGNLVDCIKPPGWVPPKTEEILVQAGYNKESEYLADDIIHLEQVKAETRQNEVV